MGYVWTETIDQAVGITNEQVDEIRTNINTERVDRAGLAAYDWTVDDLDSTDILSAEIAELRTAIDEAHDTIVECASHYTTDESSHDTTVQAAHYTSNDATHDSTVDATHYSSNDATKYTTHDSADDTTHDATAYATHNTSKEVSIKNSINGTYKGYNNGVKSAN